MIWFEIGPSGWGLRQMKSGIDLKRRGCGGFSSMCIGKFSVKIRGEGSKSPSSFGFLSVSRAGWTMRY